MIANAGGDMIHLMNSAVMTTPGIYRTDLISESNFRDRVLLAHTTGSIISHLGYPQAVDFIRKLTGIRFELNRDRTDYCEGDEALILRLAYRIENPYSKGSIQREDYEFLHCMFHANQE